MDTKLSRNGADLPVLSKEEMTDSDGQLGSDHQQRLLFRGRTRSNGQIGLIKRPDRPQKRQSGSLFSPKELLERPGSPILALRGGSAEV